MQSQVGSERKCVECQIEMEKIANPDNYRIDVVQVSMPDITNRRKALWELGEDIFEFPHGPKAQEKEGHSADDNQNTDNGDDTTCHRKFLKKRLWRETNGLKKTEESRYLADKGDGND